MRVGWVTDYGHFASLEIGAAMSDEWLLCSRRRQSGGSRRMALLCPLYSVMCRFPGHEPCTLTKDVLPLTARNSTGPHPFPRAVEVP